MNNCNSNIRDEFDILLLSETFLKSNSNFKLKEFNIIRADRQCNNGGGLAIAVRRGITFSRVTSIFNIENSLESLAISIETSLGELLIVSLCRVPAFNNFLSSDTWTNLFNSIQNLNFSSVFIAGDFNCHNSLWGSLHNCRNGLELCSALDNTNLITLNTGEPTYRTRPDSPPSIIDLAFVSQNLFNISSSGVWNYSLGSDHFPVVLSLGISTPIASYVSHKYNFKRIDWLAFSNNLSDSIQTELRKDSLGGL